MKKNIIGLSFAAIALVIVIMTGSCMKPDKGDCASTSESPVVKVTGSDTAFVNVADTLTVSFLISNSCGKSAQINPAVATTGTNVHVVTTYVGCACSEVIIQVNQKYVFKAPSTGNYTLSFWGGGNASIIEKKIVVLP